MKKARIISHLKSLSDVEGYCPKMYLAMGIVFWVIVLTGCGLFALLVNYFQKFFL